MTKPELTIDDCMSPSPYSIAKDETMAAAHALMNEHQIRHLPVMDGDTLCGLVSMRDLHILEAVEHVDPATVAVAKAASAHPYAVEIGTPLRAVVLQMQARRYGSAIVLDEGKVVGMFTLVDALRVLSNLL